MAARWRRLVKIGVATGAVTLGAGTALYIGALLKHDQRKEARQALLESRGMNKRPSESLPSRADQIKSLANDQFDVLVNSYSHPIKLLIILTFCRSLEEEPQGQDVPWMLRVVVSRQLWWSWMTSAAGPAVGAPS